MINFSVKEVREWIKQIIIFKRRTPEILTSALLDWILEQLPFEKGVIQYPSETDLIEALLPLVEAGAAWQQSMWDQLSPSDRQIVTDPVLLAEMEAFFA